jgi:hypothetical protein
MSVSVIAVLLLPLTLSLTGGPEGPPAQVSAQVSGIFVTVSVPVQVGLQPHLSATDQRRDLSVDEARGGHTLARHVGRTDEQLRQRLRAQPNISAASTYPDRETAELVVATILQAESSRLRSWTRRTGSRPNLALRTRTPRGPPTGRVLERGRKAPVEAHHAVVVLRWDTATSTYYVLTSYPEAR